MLAEDGFIFISIDVFEFTNLKCILDEIFGLANFRNCIAVRRGIKNVQAQFDEVQALSLGHEYIFLYSKNPQAKLPKLSKNFEIEKAGKWDTFWRGTNRPTMRYEIFGICPEKGQWRWEIGRATKAAKNYEKYMAEYSDTMSIDDYFLENLMATNEKLDFVRKNEGGTIQYYVPPQTGKLLSDNWMDILLSGSYANFDTEKNVLLIERIINWITSDNDVILDSFAGSGTTAHAVLNTNKLDNNRRRFILVELMGYAEDITAHRVKKVIDDTGGDFAFYNLGPVLLLPNGNLKEDVGAGKIREYVYFMETKSAIEPAKEDEPYYMGVHLDSAYYFYYQKDGVTSLNRDFLHGVKTKAERYTIYADLCTLSPAELEQYHITFKKIPRDISRL